MYRGQIVEHGAARAVVMDPREDYTKRLIAAVPTLERRSTVR
jgi:ABC-type glutathione transport system ATPase component